MPIINFTNPVSVIIGVVLFLLVLYLGKETKKSWIMAALLVAFLGLLIAHTIEFSTLTLTNETVRQAIIVSVTFDLAFVFLSFMTYLWIDDMEVKAGKKKSIDNSLDWFWNKV